MEGGFEVTLESKMSSLAEDSDMKEINGFQEEESGDVRSVVIVGAGPAGLMLA
jgi:NADPH-dependent 2,4-dienoyl-CoA reductase/sulfur reductase-like enzyme